MAGLEVSCASSLRLDPARVNGASAHAVSTWRLWSVAREHCAQRCVPKSEDTIPQMLRPHAAHPAIDHRLRRGLFEVLLASMVGRLAWLAPPRRTATARDGDPQVHHRRHSRPPPVASLLPALSGCSPAFAAGLPGSLPPTHSASGACAAEVQ